MAMKEQTTSDEQTTSRGRERRLERTAEQRKKFDRDARLLAKCLARAVGCDD